MGGSEVFGFTTAAGSVVRDATTTGRQQHVPVPRAVVLNKSGMPVSSQAAAQARANHYPSVLAADMESADLDRGRTAPLRVFDVDPVTSM
jgi:hypothetical protein